MSTDTPETLSQASALEAKARDDCTMRPGKASDPTEHLRMCKAQAYLRGCLAMKLALGREGPS